MQKEITFGIGYENNNPYNRNSFIYRDAINTETLIDSEDWDEETESWTPAKELVVERETWQRCQDIPANQNFIDMGLTHPSDYINKTRMEECILTECCVQGVNGMLMLHIKGRADIQKPHHLREETLMGKLGLTYSQAHRLSEAWISLSLDYTAVRGAMREFPTEQPELAIKQYEMIVSELPDLREDIDKIRDRHQRELTTEVTANWERLTRTYSPAQLVSIIEDRANALAQEEYEARTPQQYREEGWAYESDDYNSEEAEQATPNSAYDNFNGTLKDPVFGAHKLFTGAESLADELLYKIRELNFIELNNMKKNMFPQFNPETGKWDPPKWWMLTPSQKSQFWEAVKYRERVIANDLFTKSTPFAQQVARAVDKVDSIEKLEQLKAELNIVRYGKNGLSLLKYKIKERIKVLKKKKT